MSRKPVVLRDAHCFFFIDLAATAFCALEGGAQGARAGLDLLGVLIVGACASLAGGILRDSLLGDLPPAAFGSPARLVTAAAGAGVAFTALSLVGELPAWLMLLLDTVALALFTVTGVEKALAHGCNWFVVVFLGAVTGVGGGVVRDLLLARVPTILTVDLYASAAITAGLSMLAARRLGLSPRLTALVGGTICIAVRGLAVLFGWHLPTAQG